MPLFRHGSSMTHFFDGLQQPEECCGFRRKAAQLEGLNTPVDGLQMWFYLMHHALALLFRELVDEVGSTRIVPDAVSARDGV